MFVRRSWHARIAQGWLRRSIVWLMGVRRVGKTTLAQSLPDADYFDCELPRTRALLAHSGGIFEATRYAVPCEVSRTTIANDLAVLEATCAVHVVRPYAEGGRAELVSAPRVYGFDTGFVCHQRGWTELRSDDLGHLWEHLVLNELHAHVGRDLVRYWRTRHGSEIDFVVVGRGRPPVAIECKWAASEFDPAGMRIFRSAYPEGANLVAEVKWRHLSAAERDAVRRDLESRWERCALRARHPRVRFDVLDASILRPTVP